MVCGLLVIARMGSSRLKKKHLQQVGEKPVLHWLLTRIEHEFRSEIGKGTARIVIVSPEEEESRAFKEAVTPGTAVFLGSKQNIPLRLLQAAQAYHLDAVIAVDGDDILCSIQAMREVYAALLAGRPYVSTSGLPLGMNAGGYSAAFLEASLAHGTTEVLETGWGRIFDASQLKEIKFPSYTDRTLRFTLDYPEDFEFFKRILLHFGDGVVEASDRQVIDYVAEQRLDQITEPIQQVYWDHFNSEKEKEIRG